MNTPKEIRYLDLLRRWHDQDLGPKRPGKSVCVVRYGGIGDYIQTSSVLPRLKEQGYHVTLNVESLGYELMKHDPYIDAFFIQEKDQILREELGPYWEKLCGCFRKFINFSESVEGSLLSVEGRIHQYWPKKARHEYMNHNYLEMMHLIADVPLVYSPRFYSSRREKKWAGRKKKSMGGRFILWVLAGSSGHKTWPYLDQMIARIMLTMPDVKIVLVGDGLAQMLEIGWEKEPRVIKRAGVWTVRQTIALAEVADLVVGPETGIMNAVSTLSVPKVVMLSHSTVENLTRDWKNCISLVPLGCPCYPCHMLHHSFEYCHRDEKTGTALCQSKISVEQMTAAINLQLGRAVYKGAA